MSREEIYADAVGFPSYRISTFGNLFSNESEVMLLYRLDKHGYLRTNIPGVNGTKTVLIHRLVALTFIPNPENKPIVDHIDRNKQNNNVSNLRWATYSENSMNSKINTRNTSGFKCISYVESRKKWQVIIDANKKRHFIGYYDTLEQAVAAWNESAPIYYKEFQPIGINNVGMVVELENVIIQENA